MLTTKSVGLYAEDQQQKANPKPVTGFDYAGQPLKPGAFYNGRPEHMDPTSSPNATDSKSVSNTANPDFTGAPEPLTVSRTRRNPASRAGSKWSLERRAAISERMRQWWKQKRVVAGLNPASTTGDLPSKDA